MYSNPPIHGARIVAKVLSDPALKPLWYAECKGMADRYSYVGAYRGDGLDNGVRRLLQRHAY